MEGRQCEEMQQTSVNLKCECIPSVLEKPTSLSLKSPQALDTKIATPTPEKKNEFVRDGHREEAAELPKNYKVIAEFFNCFTCSLRLLALHKKLPTFESISKQVEVLMGRKFSCRHLSQIKHILPEAVHTDKILIHDKKTLCMKPDIKITLTFDVIEDQQEQSPFISLQQLFTSRLLDMATKLPVLCEIPEAEMPEPFNQESNKIEALPADLSTESQNRASENEQLSNSIHLSCSFNRSFSKKMVEENKKKTPLLASQIPTSSSSHECLVDQDTSSRPTSVSIPVQLEQLSSSITSTVCETTPSKVEVEAVDLSLQTPAQLTPKRSASSSDNKLKTMTSQMVTPYSAKRSLDFSVMEGEENALNSSPDEIDCLKSVDQTSHQAIPPKGLPKEEKFSNSAARIEKGEKNRGITKECSTNKMGAAHQLMPTGLSDLIALIHQSFQSVNCFSITKDELIYKIMINNFDIIERREVEEQIGLLEKLVPNWICSKLMPSGDVLYNINKNADPSSVCRSLYEQVTKTTKEHVI